MAVQRRAGGGKKHASDKVRRKRRPRPPWGNLLGGKPIKRHGYAFGQKIDLGEDRVRLLQHAKMLKLKRHHKIDGGDYAYPIKGVGAAEWLPWYQLALAIASHLDDSLKIVDASPPGKTAPRWRGIEGQLLLNLVELVETAPAKANCAVVPHASTKTTP